MAAAEPVLGPPAFQDTDEADDDTEGLGYYLGAAAVSAAAAAAADKPA